MVSINLLRIRSYYSASLSGFCNELSKTYLRDLWFARFGVVRQGGIKTARYHRHSVPSPAASPVVAGVHRYIPAWTFFVQLGRPHAAGNAPVVEMHRPLYCRGNGGWVFCSLRTVNTGRFLVLQAFTRLQHYADSDSIIRHAHDQCHKL
jgi:hypothetical protein